MHPLQGSRSTCFFQGQIFAEILQIGQPFEKQFRKHHLDRPLEISFLTHQLLARNNIQTVQIMTTGSCIECMRYVQRGRLGINLAW